MNSSLAPPGPRVRNSLITNGGSVAGDPVGEGEALGDGDADGVGDGEGDGPKPVSPAAPDSTPRALAKICTVPASTPFANPNWSMVAIEVSLDRPVRKIGRAH